MTLSLYNTMTREKSAFTPIDPQNVRMYACGPTVYDYAHIGNARAVTVFDVLFRVLSAIYPRVTYVRNITDIDDKIMDAAKANGETIGDLTRRTEQQFNDDMSAIGNRMPTHTPRATEYVPQMLEIIAVLMARGHAYEAEGHVLFNVPSMKNYGALSRRNMDDMIAGARVDVAPYKKSPADFVLWKPSTPDQPGWDSPYGRGRPGWHIECSAMAGALLGETFDIHGGGIDLIFPHHENEIAQSCCAHGTDRMANLWMHNGFITVNGEKMSKSLGNFFTVHDLLKQWPGEVIRYALLSAHYRQPLDFTDELLQQSKAALDKIYLALRNVNACGNAGDVLAESGLLDDLNTPAAITKIHEWTTALNKGDTEVALKIRKLGSLIGIIGQNTDDWFKIRMRTDNSIHDLTTKLNTLKAIAAAATSLLYDRNPGNQIESIRNERDVKTKHIFEDHINQQIDSIVELRNRARSVQNFKAADTIRDELTDMGIILEDSAAGTTWRRK